MLEYKDGRFSENMDIEKAFSKFQNAMEEETFPFKALHVGSEEELNDIRKKKSFSMMDEHAHTKDFQTQIDDLKEQLAELNPVKSQYIHIPTDQERKVLSDIMGASEKRGVLFSV